MVPLHDGLLMAEARRFQFPRSTLYLPAPSDSSLFQSRRNANALLRERSP
jgi:hypothetical protein